VEIDAQAVECQIVVLAAHGLDALFADQRHQSAAQHGMAGPIAKAARWTTFATDWAPT
jgi:hypothetical protein